MTEIALPLWVFCLYIALAVFGGATVAAFATALIAAVGNPLPSPLSEATAAILHEHMADDSHAEIIRAAEEIVKATQR